MLDDLKHYNKEKPFWKSYSKFLFLQTLQLCQLSYPILLEIISQFPCIYQGIDKFVDSMSLSLLDKCHTGKGKKDCFLI